MGAWTAKGWLLPWERTTHYHPNPKLSSDARPPNPSLAGAPQAPCTWERKLGMNEELEDRFQRAGQRAPKPWSAKICGGGKKLIGSSNDRQRHILWLLVSMRKEFPQETMAFSISLQWGHWMTHFAWIWEEQLSLLSWAQLHPSGPGHELPPGSRHSWPLQPVPLVGSGSSLPRTGEWMDLIQDYCDGPFACRSQLSVPA